MQLFVIVADVHAFFAQALSKLSLDAVVLLFGIPLSTGIVLLFCYIGSMTSISFLGFGDTSYESNWLKMPINLQRFIQLIIADAQRPLIFTGMGLVDLNLRAFAKVMGIRAFLLSLNQSIIFKWTYR